MEAAPSPAAADLLAPSGIGDRLRAERQRKGRAGREIARRGRV